MNMNGPTDLVADGETRIDEDNKRAIASFIDEAKR